MRTDRFRWYICFVLNVHQSERSHQNPVLLRTFHFLLGIQSTARLIADILFRNAKLYHCVCICLWGFGRESPQILRHKERVLPSIVACCRRMATSSCYTLFTFVMSVILLRLIVIIRGFYLEIFRIPVCCCFIQFERNTCSILYSFFDKIAL